jgi:archaemetzincin
LSTPTCILIAPIGAFPESLLDLLGQKVGEAFNCPTRVAALLEDLEDTYSIDRDQYHSTAILERLTARTPPDVLRVIALTRVDLYIPILTYVYGEAQLNGIAAIVSINRLNENLGSLNFEGELNRRITKEVLHELGHTFGLLHCKDPTCSMHYCRSIRDVDRKQDRFCRYCQVMLKDALEKIGHC